MNKTDIDIPIDVKWPLSLGPKHNLPVVKEMFPVLKIIADGEDFIRTIKGKEKQESARTKLTTIIDDHMNKIRLSNTDKFLIHLVNDAGKLYK